MKKILNLSAWNFAIAEKIYTKYNSEIMNVNEPELQSYSLRTTTKDGITALINYHMFPNGHLKINVEFNRSMLFAKKEDLLPPFEIIIDFSDKKPKAIKTPKDFRIRAFLDSESNGRTQLNMLFSMYIIGDFLLSFCQPALTTRVANNTIEISIVKDFEHIIEEHILNEYKKYNEQRITDGWDVVTLTDNQLQKIGNVLRDHEISYDIENIALKKFCLKLFSKKAYVYFFFEWEQTKVHCEITNAKRENGIKCDFEFKSVDNNSFEVSVNGDSEGMEWLAQKNDICTNWEFVAETAVAINTFIVHYGDVTMEVEEKQATKRAETHPQKHKSKTNTVRIFKSYTLVKNWKTMARKKMEITCPAWGVRGHLRHYKNGKTVFIEPYVKGPEKANYKGKEYSLLPYKDA